jgi:hypothetical protein
MFEHRQMWDHERDLAAIEGRHPARFIAKQPNEIRQNLIREFFVNSNLISAKEDNSKKYIRNGKR